MKNLVKIGGFSALYLAIFYIIGIIIFLVILDYPNIVSPTQKMDLLLENQMMIYSTNMLMYVIFGIMLAILVLALFYRLKDTKSAILPIATIIGIIWAILLISSGLIANAGIGPAIALYQQNPTQATLFWSQIETVSNGLGGIDGELFGGLMTFLLSIVALKAKAFPKVLIYLGLIAGAIGLISVIPGLQDLAGIFGIIQIIWFIWIGIDLIKNSSNEYISNNERKNA